MAAAAKLLSADREYAKDLLGERVTVVYHTTGFNELDAAHAPGIPLSNGDIIGSVLADADFGHLPASEYSVRQTSGPVGTSPDGKTFHFAVTVVYGTRATVGNEFDPPNQDTITHTGGMQSENIEVSWATTGGIPQRIGNQFFVDYVPPPFNTIRDTGLEDTQAQLGQNILVPAREFDIRKVIPATSAYLNQIDSLSGTVNAEPIAIDGRTYGADELFFHQPVADQIGYNTDTALREYAVTLRITHGLRTLPSGIPIYDVNPAGGLQTTPSVSLALPFGKGYYASYTAINLDGETITRSMVEEARVERFKANPDPTIINRAEPVQRKPAFMTRYQAYPRADWSILTVAP